MRRLLRARARARDHYWQRLRDDCEHARTCRHHQHYTPEPAANVVGVGVGEKVTERRRTGRACVTVLVAKKFPKSRVKRRDCVPKTIDGRPTDVVEVGYPVAKAWKRRRRLRPVQPGGSVSPDYDYYMAGTFGLVVTDRKRTRRFILSNNHVLADENRVAIGTRILQPGSLDSGGDPDRVARLETFVPLRFDNGRNWMDAALARLYQGVKVDRAILGIGVPRSAGEPRRNARVRKSGRTTGVTEGTIRETKVDVFDMEFEQGFVRMDDVIAIQGKGGPFSLAGDSGSAIVDSRDRVVGLLFGGSDARDYAIPIRRILRRFRVRL